MSTQRGATGQVTAFADSAAFIGSLLALNASDDRARRVALAMRSTEGWHELTYAALDAQSDSVCQMLARAGVGAGDRVVLSDESSPEWVAVLLGIWRAGAIAVPVDPKSTDAERRAITDRCTPQFVITDAVAAARDALGGDSGTGGVACSMSDPALIVWTSGTTGKPKGVTLTFGNIAYDVSAAVLAQQLAPTDRWLSVLPLHHMLELSCAVLCCLTVGAELSFAKTLMPGEIVALMQERGTTHMMTVPMLLRLLRPAIGQAGVAPHALFVGGAPLPAGTIESYAAIGIPVYQGYGLSETSPLVTANSPDHDRPGSVGRALPGTQIRVDELGELHVRSPAVMAGYWEDNALTSSVVKDGWFATGDLGFIDTDGFAYVTGRAKNLIVLESGKNVQPEEVETALHASSMFAEVCVVGVRAKGDSGSGAEEVCAVVVPTSALSHDDAAAEVARATGTLSGYKRPTLVIVSETELPKSAKRSILRRDVAAAAMERLAAR